MNATQQVEPIEFDWDRIPQGTLLVFKHAPVMGEAVWKRDGDHIVPATIEEVEGLLGLGDVWEEAARRYARNSDYYRSLVVRIGEFIGQEAYTADDGGVHDSVLCDKVPELVEKYMKA